jgi:hypothetical protein
MIYSTLGHLPGTKRRRSTYDPEFQRNRQPWADRSDEYQQAAAECVNIAHSTIDPIARIKLLTMAQ